jgi:hypothetical protein
MKKRTLLIIALSVQLLGFFGTKNVKRGKPPIILDSYAVSKVQPGATWRIYLHAKDDDGDMKDITAMLLEPGNVISPVSFTRIKEAEHRGEFKGYIHLRIPANSFFLGKTFLIRIQVRDQELSRSNAIKLPFTFANVPTENIPEKWQSAGTNRLGGIMIDLNELNDWRSVY